jgi:hypothetical protein
MTTTLSLTLMTLAAITLNAQAKSTTADDYNRTFQYAVSETNEQFPFIFTVVTETFQLGKLVSTETLIDERQAAGIERESLTLNRGDKTFRSYSIMVGFGNHTYCSTDRVSWKGPQEFICPPADGSQELRLYGPRTPEKAVYSVAQKLVDKNPVKVYRKYAIFAPTAPSEKKTFEEEIATIDSQGFFVSIVGTEGTLDPKANTIIIRKQYWDLRSKFEPVVAPK